MDKRNLNWVTWSFVILTALVVGMMLMNTMRRPGDITLPDTTVKNDQIIDDSDKDNDALTVVKITPETVQAAIATLSRPESYRRTITLEQFWDNGSASYEITTTVNGAWTRTDRTMPDGRVRHCISGPDVVYIWYNNEQELYTGSPGEITADNEQSIPTYEEILELPQEEIVVADYRSVSDVNCIYVEAADINCTLRYWLSVESGLLVAAEKLLDEETVYRMGALTVDQTEASAADFTLPNGNQLI